MRLDLLRGFAAFAMVADHIGGEDSWLYAVTGGNDFFVSAAEAFVFISGVVMGMVYKNYAEKLGVPAALMKAFHRTWSLYLLTIGLTLAFAATAYVFDLWWKPDTSSGGLGRFILDVVTLHRTLFLTDIPMLFTVLLLGGGLVILLLSQGYTLFVLAASWLVWLLWQVSPESTSLPWQIEGNVLFNIPAWQVLFVTGIVAGWHRAAIEARLRAFFGPQADWWLAVACLLVAIMYVVQLAGLDALQGNSLLRRFMYDKPDVPVGRLVVFALLATVSLTLTTVFWGPVRKFTGWLLLPLGQNALFAYSIHIFIVAVTTKLTLELFGSDTSPVLFNTALQTAGVMVVWLIVVLEPEGRARLRRGLARLQQKRQVLQDVQP